MAKFPTESRDVVGLKGDEYPSYKVPPHCARPGCTKYTDHAHHLFSRAKMGGAFDYVRTPDGTEIGNVVPLCFSDHELVTQNKVHITYKNGGFFWEGVPLAWQPPVVAKGFVPPEIVQEVPDVPLLSKDRPVCLGCGRLMPRAIAAHKPEAKKPRKTWAVMVPYTVEENGASVLDALLIAAREEMDKHGLNWGDGHRVNYYVLTTVLGLFVQHADKILGDS